jgi:GDP-D-mannose dehydratase
MRKKSLYLSLLLFLVACESSGVKTTEKTAVKKQKSVDNRSQAERLLDPAKTIVDKKEFPNGLKIQWFKKGTGPAIQPGEVVEINFKLQLPSGDVVDGNHLLKRAMIPFLVGYNMQTDAVVVRIDERYFRPAEVDYLLADPTKAIVQLGWKPEYSFEALIQEMIESEEQKLSRAKKGNL